MGFGAWGLGFGVWGLGFGGLGFQSPELRVKDAEVLITLLIVLAFWLSVAGCYRLPSLNRFVRGFRSGLGRAVVKTEGGGLYSGHKGFLGFWGFGLLRPNKSLESVCIYVLISLNYNDFWGPLSNGAPSFWGTQKGTLTWIWVRCLFFASDSEHHHPVNHPLPVENATASQNPVGDNHIPRTQDPKAEALNPQP